MGETEDARDCGARSTRTDNANELPLRVRLARRRRQVLLASALGGVALWLASGFSFGARPPRSDWSQFPVGAGRSVSSHYDPRLGAVVAQLAGRRVLVYCWPQAAWPEQAGQAGDFGVRWNAYTVATPMLTVNLSPQVCGELLRLSTVQAPLDRQGDLDALAWSVGVLAHESMHVSGIDSESVAQCYGMQAIARTAILLGRSRAEGRLLADRYWRRLYSRSPAGYSSPECRSGGLLDRRPRVDAWP